jgi:SRSO17 transposase
VFSSTRTRIALAFAIFVVLAAAVVPAAGARSSGPVQPTSPWYAYDAAVRKAQHQRHLQSVRAQLSRIPTSPWYAYDAAVRAQHKRHAK